MAVSRIREESKTELLLLYAYFSNKFKKLKKKLRGTSDQYAGVPHR
jgi:hypothetical protein